MKNASAILYDAKRHGLHIEPDGENLWVWPRSRITGAFADELRAHKVELVAWLNAQHLAKQVTFGEFDGAVLAVREDVLVILNNVPSPFTRRAAERLRQKGASR